MSRKVSRAWLCLAGGIIVGSSAPAAQRSALPESLARLEVLLTTSSNLPEAARIAMRSEAEGIWSRNGVAIDWLQPSAIRPVGSNRLRVLIVERRQQTTNVDEPFAVGELVRPDGSHPVALISLESARRLVSSVRGRAGYELIAIDERRFGMVLGRALAHEIGHFLLGTHTHARSGLMRPHFSALEFTDMRDSTFALDRAAAAWLRTRGVERFAYDHR
jgi:hypothetical protein